MYEPDPDVALHALPDYEPTHEPGEPGPPPRWSSLRPASGPQLALVAPPNDPSAPEPVALWRLVLHMLEVLDGRRNVDQLRALLSDPAYEALLTRLRVTPPGRQHRLKRLHTCHPAPGAVELAAVLEVTGAPKELTRFRGAAIRMERVAGRWHCAVLRIL